MKDIFVSYRRSDSSAIVGRVIDRLESRFGKEHIFRDLDSIEPGQDFGEAINRALGQCEVALVVIGDEWVSITNKQGERRLDNDEDWVRLEVAKALAQGTRVIPVLVEGADMPSVSQLPENLKTLAKKNAARVRDDPDFNGDMERLCTDIEKGLTRKLSYALARARKPILLAAAATAFIALAMVISSQFGWKSTSENVLPPGSGETAATSGAAVPPAPSRLHFLGIGINSYPFRQIQYAGKDIEYLQETLRQLNPASRLGDFVALYDSEATRERIIQEIEKLRQRLDRDELAIIAFSGIELVEDRFYLLPSDADLESPETTAITADDIFSVMPNAKGEVVFMLDVCRSARFGQELQQINPSIITLASTGREEFAYEAQSYREGGGGAFTTALGRGLAGAADSDQNGLVTLAELAVFARSETPRIVGTQGSQIPVAIGDMLPLVIAFADQDG